MKQIATLLSTLFFMPVLAAVPLAPRDPGSVTAGALGFEENKGQVVHTDGTLALDVRYRLKDGDTRIFLLDDGMAFQFQRVHLPEGYAELLAREAGDPEADMRIEALSKDIRVETYRMDLHFEGAASTSRITTNGRSADAVHYYTHNALGVHRFNEVIYHDIYPGIDWVLNTTAQGMKYDFVVHPGADPDRIRMAFSDHEELYLDDEGRLVQGNHMGRFIEEAPVSLQGDQIVGTRFVLEGSTLRFELDDYDKSRTLTIDPARIWGTYYGGDSNDYGRATVEDPMGNIYLAGYSISQDAIAAGGHQTTPGGAMDAMLVKFAADGTRLWATYYGGAGNDYGRGCDVDTDGNVFLAGYTLSEDNIGMDGYQNTIGSADDFDGFLVKFNTSGERQWGTYYGGVGYENFRACATDSEGNIYGAGYAGPSEDREAYIVKFDPDGNRLWGTNVGGSGNDGGNDCAVDSDGNVYLSGITASASLFASGGHQNDLAGGDDGFLVKFDPDGTQLWGTYYGGSENDGAESCAVDPDGNVFISGYTWSSSGISMNGHQNTFTGGTNNYGDAILAKFDSDGVRLWGTYYGGDEDDQAWACATDDGGNVYVAGTTLSATGIALNGHQNTLGGNEDGFLSMFSGTGELQWGTYYGTNGEDLGQACGIAANGDVLFAGTTRSINSIAQGGFQNAYGGGFYDAYLVRFEGIPTGIRVPAAVGSLQWLGQQGSAHRFNMGNGKYVRMDLYDTSGQLSRNLPIDAVEGTLTIDLSGLVPGIYVLRCVGKTRQEVVRIVHR